MATRVNPRVSGRPSVWFWLLLVVGVVVYLLTIRAGQNWTEDFARYIMHALNLLEGRSYSHFAVPFVWKSEAFSYPPGYPVMLLPVAWLAGTELYWFKVYNVFLFALFVVVLYQAFRRDLGEWWVLALILLVAANPSVWEYKDSVTSDYAFLLVAFAALAWVARPFPEDVAGRVWFGVVAVLLVYAAYAVRTVGLAIPAAILAVELLRLLKPGQMARQRLFLILIFLAVISLILVQAWMLNSESSYSTVLNKFLKSESLGDYAIENVNKWRWTLVNMFHSDLWPGFSSLYFHLVFVGLAGYGFLFRLFKETSVFEFFLLAYLAEFFVSGVGSYARYMFPVLVLLVFYALYGVRHLPRLDERSRHGLVAVITLTGLVLYGAAYASGEWRRELNPGVNAPEAVQVFEYLKTSTPKDAVILAQNPFAFSLYIRRTATRYVPYSVRTASGHRFYRKWRQAWRYYRKVGATHVVIKLEDWPNTLYWNDMDFQREFIAKQPRLFSEVYRNAAFAVYRINPPEQR